MSKRAKDIIGAVICIICGLFFLTVITAGAALNLAGCNRPNVVCFAK